MQSEMDIARFTRLLIVVSWTLLAGACVRATGLMLPATSPDQVSVEDAVAKRQDQAREAAEFWVRKRLPAGATALDPAWYERATAQARSLPAWSSSDNRPLSMSTANTRSLSPWTALGPGNIGGRTRALAFRPGTPTTLYAGGAAGGLWRSTDAGASWMPLTDLLPGISVNSVAIDSSNPDRMFIGTGEGVLNVDAVRGAGIFRSLDGGDTWTRLQSTSGYEFRFVNDLVISPNNPQVIYAATGTGVYRSLDGGDSWSISHPLSSPPVLYFGGCLDLAVRTDIVPDTLFVSCGNFSGGKIVRNNNANGAGNWEVVYVGPGVGRMSLAIAPSDQNKIYAVAACWDGCVTFEHGVRSVLRSTSGGGAGTWTERFRNNDNGYPPNAMAQLIFTNPLYAFLNECGFGSRQFHSQGWYDNVIAVDPVNPDRVWTGGIDLMRSDDGGQSFALASYWWFNPGDPNYVHADQHAIVFHPDFNGTSNQTLLVSNDGGIFRTHNGAAATAPQTASAVCGVSGNRPAVTWESLNNGYAATQFYTGAVYPDGRTYFGGTQDNGTVRGTATAGSNAWTTLLGGDGGSVAVDPGDTQVLYGSYTGISIRKSTNGGQSFISATNGIGETRGLFINPFVLDPNNSQRLWTSSENYVWRSDDAASHWVRASDGGGSFSAIAVAPGNSDLVVAGTATTGAVYRTTAAGNANASTHWGSTQLRNGDYISAVAFDPGDSNIVFATFSTFGGQKVWRSGDAGQSFLPIDGVGPGALPDVPVHSVAVDPGGNRVFVGTDIGVFVTINGGISWMRENAGFANTVVEALSIRSGSPQPEMFAFTHGRGVYRTSLVPVVSQCASGTAIPDNNPAGMSSSINLATPLRIGDINVDVRISHPRIADLSVSLRHVASNTTIALVNFANASPACTGEDVATIVDDDADWPLQAECAAKAPAANGVFRPTQSLTGLNGLPLGGAWELRVVDQAASNVGTLTSWCLIGAGDGNEVLFRAGFE